MKFTILLFTFLSHFYSAFAFESIENAFVCNPEKLSECWLTCHSKAGDQLKVYLRPNRSGKADFIILQKRFIFSGWKKTKGSTLRNDQSPFQNITFDTYGTLTSREFDKPNAENGWMMISRLNREELICSYQPREWIESYVLKYDALFPKELYNGFYNP